MSEKLPTDKRPSQLDTFLEQILEQQRFGRWPLAFFIIDARSTISWERSTALGQPQHRFYSGGIV
jgi:hypothetical protein